MPNYIFYWSECCRWSQSLRREIQETPELRDIIRVDCVEDILRTNETLPEYVHGTPTLLIVEGEEGDVMTGDNRIRTVLDGLRAGNSQQNKLRQPKTIEQQRRDLEAAKDRGDIGPIESMDYQSTQQDDRKALDKEISALNEHYTSRNGNKQTKPNTMATKLKPAICGRGGPRAGKKLR